MISVLELVHLMIKNIDISNQDPNYKIISYISIAEIKINTVKYILTK